MIVYAGKRFTATVSARRIVQVVCDKCGTEFHYQLTRLGTGRSSAPYYLGQQSAEARAGRRAQDEVSRRLEKEAELVPCPQCNWVNESLVEKFRKRLYHRAPWASVGIVILAFVLGGLSAWVVERSVGPDSSAPTVVWWGTMTAALLSPVWIILIRRRLRRRVDPNRTYPRMPVLPPGTPPALLSAWEGTGGWSFRPVWRGGDGASGDRAVFRVGQVEFPALCVACTGYAEREYRAPFVINHGWTFPAPLCRSCARQRLAYWWLAATGVAAVTVGVIALLMMLPHKMDAEGRWIMGVVIGLFAVPVAVALVPMWLCKPYRFGAVDRDRGVYWFKARDPRYTRLLMEEIAVSDGKPRPTAAAPV